MANEVVVKNFNKALFSMKDAKAGVSKQKIVEITKAAFNALRYYKHIVLNVEKFIQKCDPPLKVPAFYVVDSIVRQGIKQHKEKDVFAPRFAVNLLNTLENGLECSDEDKLKIVRVINLWRTHNVFESTVIGALLQHCQTVGLDVDIKSVELKVKGTKADMTIYSQDNGPKKQKKVTPKTPPDSNQPIVPQISQVPKKRTLSDVAPLNGISEKEISNHLKQIFPQWATLIEQDQAAFQKFATLFNNALKERVDREKASQGANISSILTQDFDYSDDEDETKQKNEFIVSKEKLDSFVSEILSSDPNFRANTAGIYAGLLSVANNPNPVPFPDVSNIFANKPPPLSNPWFNPNPFAPDQNTIPMPVEFPAKKDSEKVDSSRSSRHSKKRERSPDSQDRKRRHRHSRSPEVSEKDKERERRRNGLPSRLRDEHTIIASKTLWFGRLPTCSEKDIQDAVKDSGALPERINIISSRACAYVTMPDRRSAYKIIDRLHRDIRVNGKAIKLEWATGAGIQKSDKIMDYWDSERGYLNIPHKKLPKELTPFLEGNHLEVDTLPSNLKGKFTEKGAIEKDAQPDNSSIQFPDEIPLPTPNSLQIPQFPPLPEGNLAGLPPLAFPGFIQPNLMAALLAQQQQNQPTFDTLFSALQQNAGGLLPTPVSQAPNIFTNLNAFDTNANQQSNDQQFQSKFNNQRGGFRPPRFGGNNGGFRGDFRGDRGNFRPRFNRGGGPQNGGEFRPRGRGRGDFRGGFRQDFRGNRPPRGNLDNGNFIPFTPNNANTTEMPFNQFDLPPPAQTTIESNIDNGNNDMEIETSN